MVLISNLRFTLKKLPLLLAGAIKLTKFNNLRRKKHRSCWVKKWVSLRGNEVPLYKEISTENPEKYLKNFRMTLSPCSLSLSLAQLSNIQLFEISGRQAQTNLRKIFAKKTA